MTATVTEINKTAENTAEQEVQKPAAPVIERVKITITGVRASGNIEQELEMDQPQGTPTAQTISYAWHRVAALNAMVFDSTDGNSKATFYPLGSFEKVLVDVSPAVGVTLPS